MEQISLNFEPIPGIENPGLWTPRDLYVRMSQSVLEYFREDRRLERKSWKNIDLADLATYYSTFSNTPEGGLVVFGIEDKGRISGCNHLSAGQINQIETCHVIHCPQARPEFRRVPVVVDGTQDFCIAIFIPYIGQLVETNKGEAWIRYGESRKRMSEEERQDFRSTRQERSFELTIATTYDPIKDFDQRIIQDFCDAFRVREGRADWTNHEVLIDRHLLTQQNGKYLPYNTLVLMAANDPRLTIPGCRVRVQRFGTETEGSGSGYAPLRDMYIEGNVVKIIQMASEAISSLIYDVTWLNQEGVFVTTPEYPRNAWFEALVNACVHRSYSFSGSEVTVKLFPNRMEIESPGGFVPPVNEQTIYHLRTARNHHLMDALRYLGYVQMAREGTRRIRDSMKELQLPEPQFKQEALHGLLVRVTLFNDHITRKRATDRDVALYFGVDLWKRLEEHEIRIAAHAYRNGVIQVSAAQRITGRTWATSKKDLDRLVAKGVLVFEPGKYVRDPAAIYRLAPKEKANGE
jgi:ATP-dependent DNA helicase RecG